jgi:hypothetical protein
VNNVRGRSLGWVHVLSYGFNDRLKPIHQLFLRSSVPIPLSICVREGDALKRGQRMVRWLFLGLFSHRSLGFNDRLKPIHQRGV